MIHPRQPVLLFTAAAVLLAVGASGISAQRPSTLERPLSDAVSEALRSSFHSAPEPPGSLPLLVPTPVVPLSATSARTGPVASPKSRSPDIQVPPAAEPSRGKMFLLTALSAAAGYGGTLYWVDRCNGLAVRDPVLPPRSSPPPANDVLCPTDSEGVMFVTGWLATITVTTGAATLAGGGFGRSLAGSALGLAGGWLTAGGVGSDLPIEAVVGLMALAHAGVTTLIAR